MPLTSLSLSPLPDPLPRSRCDCCAAAACSQQPAPARHGGTADGASARARHGASPTGHIHAARGCDSSTREAPAAAASWRWQAAYSMWPWQACSSWRAAVESNARASARLRAMLALSAGLGTVSPRWQRSLGGFLLLAPPHWERADVCGATRLDDRTVRACCAGCGVPPASTAGLAAGRTGGGHRIACT